MKKVLAILMIATFMFSGSIFASAVGVEAMNVPVWATQDESLVYDLFPSLIVKNSKKAVLELDGINAAAEVSGYANLPLGDGVLGLLVNDPIALGATTDLGVFGIVYGMDLGGMLGAIAISYGSESDIDESVAMPGDAGGDITVNNPGQSLLGVKAGLTVDGDAPIDAVVSFVMSDVTTTEDTVKDATGVITNEDIDKDSAMTFGLDIRAAMDALLINLGGTLTLAKDDVTDKNYAAGVLTLHDEDLTETTDIGVELGIAGPIKAGDAITIIPGASVGVRMDSDVATDIDKLTNTYNADKVETSVFGIQLVCFVGAVGNINETWSVKGGVQKTVYNRETTETKTTDQAGTITVQGDIDTITNASDATVELGLSGKIGSVTIDLLMNKDIIVAGPEFISGADEDIATKAAVTVEW